ncbi:hypothetical protein V5799_014889 [Amblyomma americanum]|uniref:Uncharacterized protein n=1 Tax=Amblyomma americanum TaxID=6943 RepID=A0AAQ4E1Q6_AMBAM
MAFKVLWVDALRLALCLVAYYASIFARIPALELLLNSCSEASMTVGVLLFAATATCELLLSCYFGDLVNSFGSRIRSLLQGVVFQKVTTMSALTRARYTAAQITSLLSVDCWQVAYSSFAIPVPLFGAIFLPFVFWMLGVRAGLKPTLCCVAWTVVVLSLPVLCTFYQNRTWKNTTRARDERLKATTDLLSTIRVVKMYAWEDALQENVRRFRDIEIKWLFHVNLLDAVLDCVYSSTSSVLTIILFSTLAVLEPGVILTPSLTFTCVSLLYMTDLTMNGCGQALRGFTQSSVALNRISEFCIAEYQENQAKEIVNDAKAQLSVKNGSVVMEKCCFSWYSPLCDKAQPQLIDINLAIEPGSLIGVVGIVGSGKSSLLASVLGDMHLNSGHVACAGRIAFAPQLPILHNMTIRDNILYGRPMDSDFYHQVLQSCQLVDDINRLNSGDTTEVGEKGTNLSGGQKQRVSIARAVYSSSDVYLLDDPLSALDPVVARRVFKNAIGNRGLLADKASAWFPRNQLLITQTLRVSSLFTQR